MASGDYSSSSSSTLDVLALAAAEINEARAEEAAVDGGGGGGLVAAAALQASRGGGGVAGADNEVWEFLDDASDEEGDELCGRLAKFDLSPRMSAIPRAGWSDDAKEKAAKIRNGECATIVW